ncbi:MAG: SIMPL domain-containing protein [Pyrinomonadaceae bacterium]|nr:SIMPL domain-containing protein [Pyrinomonadaceae bacterium]
MKSVQKAIVVLAVSLLVAAQATEARTRTKQGKTQEVTLRGRLGRTVEAGGWLIIADGKKYLILNAGRFQTESWFREAAEVEATGTAKPDTITTYQEGMPFEVRTMRAVGSSAGTNNVATTTNAGITRVLVTGDSIVQAQPDTAVVTVAVVTQSATALVAQQENATRTEAVLRAVRAAAGAGAEIKTSGYNLQPQYNYQQNQPPTITSYQATNSVTVTLSDLTKVGPVIDAAAQAGANNVSNLSFILRRDRPARDQALTEATREALSKAQVMAQALGGRVIRIVEVQEAGAGRPPIVEREANQFVRGRTSQADTPIETGTLDIRAQVQLIAEIETRQ